MNTDTPKHTDHHFKKMNEYKYKLIEVEPRKSYEQLEMLKLCESIIKTALQLHQKKTHEFKKSGITNNSEGPEMVVNEKKRVKIVDFLKLDISTRLYNVIKFIDEEFEFIHEIDYRKWMYKRRFGKKTLNELIKISLEQNILLHKTIS